MFVLLLHIITPFYTSDKERYWHLIHVCELYEVKQPRGFKSTWVIGYNSDLIENVRTRHNYLTVTTEKAKPEERGNSSLRGSRKQNTRSLSEWRKSNQIAKTGRPEQPASALLSLQFFLFQITYHPFRYFFFSFVHPYDTSVGTCQFSFFSSQHILHEEIKKKKEK